jgi:uncharacterized protein YfaS (alpha-2-macroglobulin family)
MHVAELWICNQSGTPQTTFVRPNDPYWKVKIVDQSGNPVSGVSVSCDCLKPNGTLWNTRTATTGADGYATMSENILNNSTTGTYTVNMASATKSGWTYNAAANAISSTTFLVQ